MKTGFLSSLACTGLIVAALSTAAPVSADPPSRVARVSYLGGEVSFAPAGEDSWYDARLNRPLVASDRLWTGPGGRVELELGTALVRLDEDTSFEFLALDDELAQIQLTEGTLSLRIDHLHPGQVYEVDTPTLAFVATHPGDYRLDIAPRGESTQVTVFSGHADVYGENSRTVQVQEGLSYQFFDTALVDYERLTLPRPDAFDDWVFARNDRYTNAESRRYVSTEMIGYADLDDYGSWRSVSDYGHVWFPRRVPAGWAPYRQGHWAWVEPWGWSWIDDEPWGFAPFHYGRWVYVANGWGWVPGPRNVRPVYAPALVAFVGGSGWSLTVSSDGPPIGWFPLGPRDVYVPWYHVSRGYFGRVNVHNTTVVNNIYVTNIYNDYYVQGRPLRREYTFRNAASAVTVVPRDSFVSARSAAESMARLRPGVLERGELVTRAPAAPVRSSLAAGRVRDAAPARSFDRTVMTRNTPPARTVSFDMRERAIARNGGEPLASDQLQRLNARVAAGLPTGRMADTMPSSAGSEPRRAVGRGTDMRTPVIAGDHEDSVRGTRGSAGRPSRADADAAVAARESARTAAGREGALPSSRYSPRHADVAPARSAADEGITLPPRSTSSERQRETTRSNPSPRSAPQPTAPTRQIGPRTPVRERPDRTAEQSMRSAPARGVESPVQRSQPSAPSPSPHAVTPSRAAPVTRAAMPERNSSHALSERPPVQREVPQRQDVPNRGERSGRPAARERSERER